MSDVPSGSPEPIISVSLEIEGWEEFKKQFDDYRRAAENMSGPWKDFEKTIEILNEHMEEAADSAEGLAEGVSEIFDDDDGKSSKRTRRKRRKKPTIDANNWANIFKPAKSFVSNVGETSHHLLKWSRLTKLFTAIVAAGGLFGLDRLAIGAGERRQAAMGYGVGIGELSAFRVNYARIGNAESILSGFGAAAHDYTKRPPLYALGVQNPQDMDATEAFTAALPKIKELLDRSNPQTLYQTIDAYGLSSLGIGLREAENIRNMSPKEIQEMIVASRRDQHALDTPDNIARQWQDFTNQIERAGDRIEVALAKGLVGLSPGIQHLSQSSLHLIDEILSHPDIKKYIDKSGKQILAFASQLGGKDTMQTVEDMLKHIDMSARGFETMNEWIETHKATIGAGLGAFVGMRAGPFGALIGAGVGAMIGGSIDHGNTMRRQYEDGRADERAMAGSNANDKKYLNVPPPPNQAGPQLPNQQQSSAAHDDVVPSGNAPDLKLGNLFGRLPDVENVDPQLKEIVAAAQSKLPQGYTMKVMAGYDANGHAPGSQHHVKGKGALDVQIFDLDGHPIANRGNDPTGMYHQLARAAYGEMLARHPELKGTFTWGGEFETTKGSGTPDLMHFDIGGERGIYDQNRLTRMGPLDEQLKKNQPPPTSTVPHPTAKDVKKESELRIHNNLHGQANVEVV